MATEQDKQADGTRRRLNEAFAAGLRHQVEIFVNRHVSVLRALQAFGFTEDQAKPLIERTRLAGGTEYRVTRDGQPFVIRQMKGWHADVFRLEDEA